MIKKLLLIVLLFTPLILTQTFHSLDGVEDQQGNTHLFFRYGKNELKYNVVRKLDPGSGNEYSVMIGYMYNSSGEEDSKSIEAFDFAYRNPDHFITGGYRVNTTTQYGYVSYNDYVPTTFVNNIRYVSISKQNDSHCFASDGRLLRSFDGGLTWPIDSIRNFRFLKIFPDNENEMFGLDAQSRLIKSTDGGVTSYVVNNSTAFDANNFKFYFDVNGTTVYMYVKEGYNYKLYRSDSRGEASSWFMIYDDENQFFVTVDAENPGEIYISKNNHVYKSTNFGASLNHLQGFWYKVVGVYKKPGSGKLYAGTKYHIYEINTGVINSIRSIPLSITAFEWFPLHNGNKWIRTYWNLGSFCSPEQSFEQRIQITGDTLINSLRYYIFNQSVMSYMGTLIRIDSTNGIVYQYNSTDAEESILYDLRMQLGDTVYYYPEHENYGFLVCFESDTTEFFGQQRPYKKFGGMFGFSYTIVKGLGIYVDYFCDLAGHESIVKGCEINGTVYGDTTFIVSVDDDPDKIPTEFKLEQNYPNPFNPSTRISFSIPVVETRHASSLLTTLKVYDVLGREVATLVNEYRDAGSYEIQFDGAQLASGIYYYQLKAGELIQTKKMVLIK